MIPIEPSAPDVYLNESKIPTSPLVPIPPPLAPHFTLKTQVERGPEIAEEMIIGSMITGFFMIFGICNILVPSPCAISPLHLFSRKEATAKPIIWHAQPTVAAPPARSMAL